MIHAHVEIESRDCDGRYTYGYTMTPDTEVHDGGAEDFADIRFHDRVVSHVVNSYALLHEGTLTVTRLDRPDEARLSWYEQTEEGYRSVEATICTDDCPTEDPWQRDHTAEAAGY